MGCNLLTTQELTGRAVTPGHVSAERCSEHCLPHHLPVQVCPTSQGCYSKALKTGYGKMTATCTRSVLGARSLELRCWWGCALSETRVSIPHCLFPVSFCTGDLDSNSGLDLSLQSSIFRWCSPCLIMSSHGCRLTGTPVILVEGPLYSIITTHLNSLHLREPYSHLRRHPELLGLRTSEQPFGRTQFNPEQQQSLIVFLGHFKILYGR